MDSDILDPTCDMDKMFYWKATLTWFVAEQGWWYIALNAQSNERKSGSELYLSSAGTVYSCCYQNRLNKRCLWILGNGRTLCSRDSFWEALVLGAKGCECFFNADQDKDLVKAMLCMKKELDHLIIFSMLASKITKCWMEGQFANQAKAWKKNVFGNLFRKLEDLHERNPCIDDADNDLLLKQITDDELWEAVNAIGALKAPGPDGLHASFYQNCWMEIKDTVIPMIKGIFNDSTTLNLINHTNIALIPKVDEPSKVNDFRPISLCNVSYKILTKILVKRLKPLLTKCISKNQGAFAPGRAIQDNVLIAHELFSDFQRKKGRVGSLCS
ncbi:hypothetical protein ACLB2K_066244 [Fragaria x ananassa]